MNAETLSYQLRREDDPYLARRRGIVGLTLVSIASMGAVTLFQMGIIEHLPEPPGFKRRQG